MRHGKKINHLGRKAEHRQALLANMAASLIEHKHIKTTLAKAKALRKYVEPLITKSKDDSTHARRVIFSYLQNKEVVKKLFAEVAPKIADRPGGYTRILKTGFRLGDNAEMCYMELVDFNPFAAAAQGDESATRKRTRRSRRKGAADSTVETAAAATYEDVVADEIVANENTEVTEDETK
ncbi:MAG: 50S ribosomal protein L17 [Sphingobacteriales bacterium]|jgi:large subunit ribosomal protein L17|nr:50S ribosomal protein L17 [Sphingobacteriales bacterium]MBP9140462.1 50S ribosomal protein L17 [Chitinophagales bacterium]MDA0197438.1 50S ribosomal protein L17 [Bacteroidota bacterium]MBK6891277.1 50S ribosomal protein L17 [Sphingobacteriales bacterium]MBK7526893.1 50S ribosomal protein L17 [Sphingobacteriales bacterium]